MRPNSKLTGHITLGYTELGSGSVQAKELIWSGNPHYEESNIVLSSPNFKQTTVQNSLVLNTRWSDLPDDQKLEEFRKWLEAETQLDIEAIDDAFWEEYIREGYERGAGRAFDQVNKTGLATRTSTLDFLKGRKSQFLTTTLQGPESVSKLKLLVSRTFSDIKGADDQFKSSLRRVLADGLVEGRNPRDIAREVRRVTDISKRKAETIARTEIIRAHAEGQLVALEELGVTEVGVMVEWLVTDDERLCPRCRPMAGVILKIKEARGKIPLHPNCRCTWVPANIGDTLQSQKKSKRRIQKAISESIKAGGDRNKLKSTPITKTRPKPVID